MLSGLPNVGEGAEGKVAGNILSLAVVGKHQPHDCPLPLLRSAPPPWPSLSAGLSSPPHFLPSPTSLSLSTSLKFCATMLLSNYELFPIVSYMFILSLTTREVLGAYVTPRVGSTWLGIQTGSPGVGSTEFPRRKNMWSSRRGAA